jgi:Holliday junction resolvasome RuvABC endonuclease subunit
LDKEESKMFITEFPKEGFSIIDQLQGRVQFAILDQIKLMKTSGMKDKEISETILANVQKIIENYQPQKD